MGVPPLGFRAHRSCAHRAAYPGPSVGTDCVQLWACCYSPGSWAGPLARPPARLTLSPFCRWACRETSSPEMAWPVPWSLWGCCQSCILTHRSPPLVTAPPALHLTGTLCPGPRPHWPRSAPDWDPLLRAPPPWASPRPHNVVPPYPLLAQPAPSGSPAAITANQIPEPPVRLLAALPARWEISGAGQLASSLQRGSDAAINTSALAAASARSPCSASSVRLPSRPGHPHPGRGPAPRSRCGLLGPERPPALPAARRAASEQAGPLRGCGSRRGGVS